MSEFGRTVLALRSDPVKSFGCEQCPQEQKPGESEDDLNCLWSGVQFQLPTISVSYRIGPILIAEVLRTLSSTIVHFVRLNMHN